LRLRGTKNSKIDLNDWALLPPSDCDVQINVGKEKATIINNDIKGEVFSDGTVNYYKIDGTPILKEYWKDKREQTANIRPARNYKSKSSNRYEISVYFKANEGEHFYGMGQHQNNCLDLKGCTVELSHKNTQSSIPFVMSSKGYGFIWNNPAIGYAELVKNHTMWNAQLSKQIDYIIFTGKNPPQISKRLAEILGFAPMLPEWAAGYWQSKLRYESQEKLLETAREYKRRDLPISVIVIDFFHWIKQGEWRFDPDFWPDPQAMVDELKSLGIKVMVSIWPTVDVESENYEEMLRNDYLVKSERGVPLFFLFKGAETYYDATNPEARKYHWNIVKENYYNYGIDIFWLDEAEPEIRPYDYENLRYHLGNGLEVSNIYPFMHAKAYYDGMVQEGQKGIANLIRCCWLGSQRFGVIGWSGDIPSTFEALEQQIKVGLNFSICGVPWWTSDIGGFHGGDPSDPMFRELFVRWFQFGVFCPIFRNHGKRLPAFSIYDSTYVKSAGPNEIWDYGKENYPILKNYLTLRERLKPYIMKQMEVAHKEGLPVIRPMFYNFPKDKKTYTIENQYMFGSDILVAPITEYKARTRKVYLPQREKWINAFTGKVYRGGQWIECDAPIEQIPIFVLDKKLIPIIESAFNY